MKRTGKWIEQPRGVWREGKKFKNIQKGMEGKMGTQKKKNKKKRIHSLICSNFKILFIDEIIHIYTVYI